MTPRGERHPLHKLTWEAVRAIRERRARGETEASIAAAYGVAQSRVHEVVRGGAWSEGR